LLSPQLADVAELADAQVSEACGGNIVEVQVLSSAPSLTNREPARRLAFLFATRRPVAVFSYQEPKYSAYPGENKMSFDYAAVSEPLAERQTLKPASAGATSHLRLAELPVRDRVQRLVELAFSLLRETETLARDNAFTESSGQLKSLDLEQGIDFNEEVKQFEIGLITLAMNHVGGTQAKAARLLRIKPTTLNSKIKALGIQY
jgi:DNA-binding protein Fis